MVKLINMKITKKQVKAIDKGELTVRELFPDVFEVKRESGWYKHPLKDYPQWLNYFDFEKNERYGFNLNGRWMTSKKMRYFNEGNALVKATPEEVETALINEAKMRGYKYGNHRCISGSTSINDFNDYDYDLRNDSLFRGLNLVFKNGKWAEIITQPEPIEMTVAEIEQKLNINNLKIVK